MGELNGRVAIVTGSATGSGAAIAKNLAEKGARICVNYSRSKERAESTLRDILDFGVEATIFQADVGDEQSVMSMIDHVMDRFGQIDILVNNAGMTHFIPQNDLGSMTDSKWDQIMRVNLKGAFYASKAAMPQLVKSSVGSIVNISSVAGLNGSGSSIAYAASKAGLISLTKSLAREFAPEVRVNAVAPGVILTRWVAGKDKFIDDYINKTLLKRACTADDIGHAVVYLSEADTVTGTVMVLDSGLTLS